MKYRLEAMFPGTKYKVIGEPKDIGAAHQLASEDRYQFQWWPLSLIRARPLGGETGWRSKGHFPNIDFDIYELDRQTKATQQAEQYWRLAGERAQS